MSTLRISNIEAKADISNPTVNEKVKITNSSGRVLVQVDGSTAGITTVGINTTSASFVVDDAQNVQFAGTVSSQNINTSSINNGPLAGFRNAIINGNFDIWQRGTSFTGLEYGADRWFNNRTGTTCTMSRQAFTLGQTDVPGEPTYFCRMAVTSVAGAGNFTILQQRIESVRTFAGQQVTVSFWAKADATKPIAIELGQYFGTGGSPSSFVGSIGTTKVTLGTSWQKVTVTANVPSISGKVLGSDNNDWLQLNIWLDAGSNFNSRTNTLGQQSGTFDIAQVQVEAGPVATPFERRSFGQELALCQRYFQWFGAGTTGQEETTTTFSIAGTFIVPMRAAPTATYIGSTYSTRLSGIDRTIAGVSINTLSITTDAAWIFLNASGGNLAGRFFQNRNAASTIQLSAEL